MAYVRFRSTHYNTSGPEIEWTYEILDTEPVAQVINFESNDPNISFEGLTTEMKPGIYPTTVRFQFYVRSAPKLIGAKVYGPSESIITDLLTSEEGRFRVKIYKNGALYFVGIILPDQSTYEDGYYPYVLNITAADGLYRLKDKSYLLPFGELETITCSEILQLTGTAQSTPLSTCLEGTEWTLIEHYSAVEEYTPYQQTTSVSSTYARWVQFAFENPGDGWVLQADGKYAKAPTYTNENILIDGVSLYHLTRDIADPQFRTVTEMITALIGYIGLGEEYEDVMWDTTMDWYEHSMANFTADPLSMIRLHEKELKQGDMWSALEKVCKLFYMRLFHAAGRYHLEQISARDTSLVKRHKYAPDGTFVGTETVNLDKSITTEDIKPGSNGTYRILPALAHAEVKIKLDGGNILDGEEWRPGNVGQRYLGRISREDGIQKIRLELSTWVRTTYDKPTQDALGPDAPWVCANLYFLYFGLRLVDTITGLTYYLTGDAGTTTTTTDDDATLDSSAVTINKIIRLGSDPDDIQYKSGRYTILEARQHRITSEDMPGGAGATYDVYLTINYGYEWWSAQGTQYWGVENPDKVTRTWLTTGKLTFIDEDDREVNGEAEKTFYVKNGTKNSLKIENEVDWSDTSRKTRNIDVLTATGWKRSTLWSIGGVGTGQPIMALCASEIMSLRLTPKKVYQGSFLTGKLQPDHRVLRDATYYLPLRVELSPNDDSYTGDFVEIAKTTPPDVDLIDVPLDQSNDGPILIDGDDGQDGDDLPLVLETNQVITAASTLTQIDVINTAGWTIGAGMSVKLTNLQTGDSELVVLAQTLNPLDTVMYIDEKTMEYGYPDASPILLDGTSLSAPKGNYIKKYATTIEGWSGSEFYIDGLPWLWLAAIPSTHFGRKVKVFRNQLEMLIKQGPYASGEYNPLKGYIDPVAKKILFDQSPPCIPFTDELLRIDIDTDR